MEMIAKTIVLCAALREQEPKDVARAYACPALQDPAVEPDNLHLRRLLRLSAVDSAMVEKVFNAAIWAEQWEDVRLMLTEEELEETRARLEPLLRMIEPWT